jgi:hypothetical protein
MPSLVRNVGQTIAVCGLPSSRQMPQQTTKDDRLLHVCSTKKIIRILLDALH